MKAPWLLLLLPASAAAYPLDAFPRTGIRRLEGYRLAHQGKVKSAIRVPPGGMHAEKDIRLRLTKQGREFTPGPSPQRDPVLQKGLERIFAARHPSYGVAVLDVSDPAKPRYAAVRENMRQIPGSVGKILVAAGLLDVLAATHPAIADRERVLRDTVRAADEFILTDGKTVPLFDPGDAAILNRPLRPGDRFSLWEWLDHMLSQSSNAAGSFVWKEALLLRHFGKRYPPSPVEESAFLRDTPKARLGADAVAILESPLRAAALDPAALRLGTMFTRRAQARVPGASSYATPLELLRWLVRMEQGRIVDEWTSLELKKLLYFARPRYRYAAAPQLARAAVYFKSGSFFQCKPEEGLQCVQYRGNVTNIMNSVAVVESGGKVYLVALISNVLKINSAVEHMTIAGEIERLVQSLP